MMTLKDCQERFGAVVGRELHEDECSILAEFAEIYDRFKADNPAANDLEVTCNAWQAVFRV